MLGVRNRQQPLPDDGRPASAEVAADVVAAGDARRELVARAVRSVVDAVWLLYRLVATLLLAGGAVAQIALILARNLFGAQPASTTVAATLALTMGGILYIGVCPSHISFHLVTDGMSRVVPGFRVLTNVIAAAVAGALAYYGARAVEAQHDLGATVQSFNFPVWVSLLVVPLAATALCVRFLAQAVGAAREAREERRQ